jgi:hypothetical protein
LPLGKLLPSFGVCRPLTFHILVFSSETSQPNEHGRKHLWKVLSINKHGYQGFQSFFYNRRYFLNFRRYLKNKAEGRKGSRGRKLCEKEKDKAKKRILRSLSFDNNGLVKPSCGTVALYGPFFFF